MAELASPFQDCADQRWFLDNVHGVVTWCDARRLGRELSLGHATRTTHRTRCLIHALLKALGLNTVLTANPPRKDIVGLGLSDHDSYAPMLARAFRYTNTHYHRRPRLDVARWESCAPHAGVDFITSAEVFEHVPPPVRGALENCRRMLRPGGVMVFSVPWGFGATVEHFPDLHDWRLRHSRLDRWLGRPPVLVNRDRAGRVIEHRDLAFHGGAGFTLEMRRFGIDDLKADLLAAGFSSVEVVDEDVPLYGIWYGAERWATPIIARA